VAYFTLLGHVLSRGFSRRAELPGPAALSSPRPRRAALSSPRPRRAALSSPRPRRAALSAPVGRAALSGRATPSAPGRPALR
jgi:hypothetical protein